MLAYIIRRILYAIPIIIGVNLITFGLFFFVNTPDDMAKTVLGEKRVTQVRIDDWKREKGYHLARLLNWDNSNLKPDNVYAWYGLCAKLVAEATAERSTPGRKLWEHLSPDAQDVVRGAPEEEARLPVQVKARILQGLNGVLDEPDLVQAEDFAGALPIAEAEALLAKNRDDLSKRELRRLNRIFLETVFPEEIAKGLPLERGLGILTQTIFWQKNAPLFTFHFGNSDFDGTSISRQIGTRMGPSLCITLPLFVLPICFTIFLGMMVAYYRGTYIDVSILFVCVLMMSISGLFYIIGGQMFFAKWLKLFPISGFARGIHGLKFLFLPILIGFITSLPGGIRYDRTLFLEEINKDYVRTARSKGLSEGKVLFKHALKNAMIPILTSVVLSIPFLIMGNLMLEQFFSIPGLGNYTIEALNQQDFAVIRSMVYLVSVFNVVGLLLVDISYTIVDPRIRFS